MIRNYLKTAWRNLWKSRFYTGIGILGLTIGLTVGIFILIWVRSELGFNDFNEEAGRIYRAASDVGSQDSPQVWESSPGPVAFFAKKEVPGIVNAVRTGSNWEYSVFSYEDSSFDAQKAVYTDPEFFEMFNTRFIQGDTKKPFRGNNSIVLSESAAKRFFGNEDPMGKVISGDYRDNYTVVGIIQDLPSNSSVDYEVFFPISIIDGFYSGNKYWKSKDSDWGNFNYITYLQLAPGVSPEKTETLLSKIRQEHDPNTSPKDARRSYRLQHISDMNLYYPNGTPGRIRTVRIFIVVLFLILLIASINYINLSTARALKRAKEVSIRKIIGADKRQLFFQFITESVVFFCLAILLAIGCIALLKPYFSELSAKELEISLYNTELWQLVCITFLSTLTASSIYPALLLTSFKPISAVKGKVLPGMASGTFRKALVTVQFVFSIILITGTLIIGEQLRYIRTKDPGYNRTQILTFRMRGNMQQHFQAVKTQINNLPGVQAVATGTSKILDNGMTTGDTDWENKGPDSDFIVNPLGMDEDFIPLMKMQLAEGKNFTGSTADSSNYILNETAVKLTGLKDPIGKKFSLWEKPGTIIGVVKDFNYASMKNKIGPVVIHYSPDAPQLHIKVSGKDIKNTVIALEGIWNHYNSGFPFHYAFLDEDFEYMYRSDIRTSRIFNLFAAIAVFVSCLGLFGLTTYTTQLKKSEIGIRKVLGASVTQITQLLSLGLLKLVLISSFVAIPLAWYLIQTWLQDFAYRTAINWWIFALPACLTLAIAFLTISFQTIKAAMTNPVKSLRTE